MKTEEKYKSYKILRAGNPLLKEISQPVTDPTAENIKKIVQRMYKTIESSGGGIGLAAPQVGEMIRLFIFNIPEDNNKNAFHVPWTTVINPKIEILSEDKEEEWEGCFCFPKLMFKIERYNQIRYSYQDLNGKFYTAEANGYHARAIQHELDHLDGILMIDRLKSPIKFNYEHKISD